MRYSRKHFKELEKKAEEGIKTKNASEIPKLKLMQSFEVFNEINNSARKKIADEELFYTKIVIVIITPRLLSFDLRLNNDLAGRCQVPWLV